ncbi:MAG: tyrosine-type recombinase/integrase [Brevinemataceae bacterium]
MNEISKYAEEFISVLKVQFGVSHHTVRAYQFDIRQFIEYCGSRNCLEFENITPMIVSEWLQRLSLSGDSSRTAARRLSSVRSWFKFLERRKVITENILRIFLPPKHTKHIPNVVSEDQISDFFRNIPEHSILHRRDKYILMFMYGTGMRAQEICDLRLEDIISGGRMIVIHGKGGKQRIVPLIKTIQDILEQWLFERSLLDKSGSAYIFLSINGKALTTSMITKIVNKYSYLISGKKLHPHMFRYTFASQLLDRGADIRSIQELLGHAGLSSTQRYTKLSILRLKENYNRFHPRG